MSQFDNSVVDEVSNHKHLGIVLSSYLGWANHIDEICAKAMRRLDVIQSFKFKLDRNALERFYMSFVPPIMEYGDVVWADHLTAIWKNLTKSIYAQ